MVKILEYDKKVLLRKSGKQILQWFYNTVRKALTTKG